MTLLKFRAYDLSMDYWYQPEEVFISNGNTYLISDDDEYHKLIMNNDVEIMQSSGLLDKKDKEIFDSDIVRFSIADGFDFVVDEIGLVAYQSGAFRVLSGLDEYLVNDNDYLIDDIDEIEVIGNKFENSELLESEVD